MHNLCLAACILFFCIEFNVAFNTFQFISGKGMITTLVLSHWNITLQAQSYDIPHGQPVFVLNYPLYVECLTREFQLPFWNLWFKAAGKAACIQPNQLYYWYKTDLSFEEYECLSFYCTLESPIYWHTCIKVTLSNCK